MKTLTFNGCSVSCEIYETVLDAFIRQGVSVPYSCSDGTCHNCLLKVTKGIIPKESQRGLKPYLSDMPYFFPCKCKPVSDMEMELPKKEDMFSVAVVVMKKMISDDVCKILLEIPSPLDYLAGQYINIRHPKGAIRSYSLFSVPGLDSRLEIHVKRMNGGKVSNWIIDQIDETDHIEYQGVFGDCYYQSDTSDRNMLLIGTGTGLSALAGIARDALNNGHAGQIFLYHGEETKKDLYLHKYLLEMSQLNDNFHYSGCLSKDSDQQDCSHGRVNTIAFSNHEDLAGWGVYLCGHAAIVEQGISAAKTAGVLEKDIRETAFRFIDKRKIRRNIKGKDFALSTTRKSTEERERVSEVYSGAVSTSRRK